MGVDPQTVMRGSRSGAFAGGAEHIGTWWGEPAVRGQAAEYGVTYRYHGIRCRGHRRRGIKCVNRSGHGFRVSVDRQRRF
jgi:hypothetical protein